MCCLVFVLWMCKHECVLRDWELMVGRVLLSLGDVVGIWSGNRAIDSCDCGCTEVRVE